MRAVRWFCLFAAWLVAGSASAATQTSAYTGISLSTPYPTQILQLRKQVDIPLTVHNYGLPPQTVALSVAHLPKGWQARFKGGDEVVGAVFVGTGHSRAVTLELSPAAKARVGGPAYSVELTARGRTAAASLPLKLGFTKAPPAALKLRADLPTLQGSSSTEFTYHLTLENQSSQRISANLAAQAPQGFQVSFSPQFGSQNVTSLPIGAGKSKKIDVKVDLPAHASARTYLINVEAQAGSLSARRTLKAVVTGSPLLDFTTPSGRLSGSANAGHTTAVHLVLTNSGSAPAQAVKLSADTPSHWQVSFHPADIPMIPPNDSAKLVADVHPASKSLAGDYMVTFDANSAHGMASANADYRVTVSTSTEWGIVGVAIVVIVILVVGFAVARFGRR